MAPFEAKAKAPYDIAEWSSWFEGERGQEKHGLIYRELINSLGARYVSDDPAVAEAYAREKQTPLLQSKGRAEFVVLPGNANDVQQLIKLANRYKFPFSVSSSGMSGSCFAAQGIPYWCQVDLKRMDKFEIDEKNMYAVVEPYVTNGQLQIEAMKRGLYVPTISAGGASSIMANHLMFGIANTAYRTGYNSKNILGVEMVLPNGEILRTGSLAVPGAGYFWGEGPGPDLRALVRGLVGHQASLGVVTKIAVKLFPWPGPREIPVEGIVPDIKVTLPEDSFKWYFFSYATLEKSLDAMRKIGESEIGGAMMRVSLLQVNTYCQRSREEFWQNYAEGYWDKILNNDDNLVMVGLWGYASPQQVEYESKVIEQIISETGGRMVPNKVYPRLVQSLGMDSIMVNSAKKGHVVGFGGTLPYSQIQTLGDVLRARDFLMGMKEKYSDMLIDWPPSIWVMPFDFCHLACTELYTVGAERGEASELRVMPAMMDMVGRLMQDKVLCLISAMIPMNITGSAFANTHLISAHIKEALDPNYLANPTRFIDMVEMEKGKTGKR
ncbi:FAD-binding oxidoreductase [Chloroflexota bacterium]